LDDALFSSSAEENVREEAVCWARSITTTSEEEGDEDEEEEEGEEGEEREMEGSGGNCFGVFLGGGLGGVREEWDAVLLSELRLEGGLEGREEGGAALLSLEGKVGDLGFFGGGFGGVGRDEWDGTLGSEPRPEGGLKAL
jgi:hypothetical protein